MPLPSYQIVLASNELISPNVRKLTFEFSKPQSFSYRPGQFVSFSLPYGEKPLKRSYSIANLETPDEQGLVTTDYLEIVISHVANGRATKIFFEAKAGDSFEISGPVGLLVLGAELPKRIFLIGTGTGMAPYRAMLNQLPKLTEQQFHILFGAQKQQDMFYLDDFWQAHQAKNIQFHPCLSRQIDNFSFDCYQGYVQQQLVELKPDPETDLVYLCGNPNMVDEVFAMLKDKGFGVKQVKREKYVFSKF
ncbi:FAD-binding oxidoreductase [Kangiella sp. TOML190]|uniref:FAD-binding oxidoreductase n=1 Tax=Kangiella sp. TOML190 TaxID=2931351 RepID=UPI00204150B0|nr:FAD-binding oxidoreductase [Kangiella sp. TOML190]